MLSKHDELRDHVLDVSVSISGFSTDSSLLTSSILGSNQPGQVHRSTGTATSTTTTPFLTTKSSGGNPDSTAETDGGSTGEVRSHGASYSSEKSTIYATTSISRGAPSTTQKKGHGGSSSPTSSGSLSTDSLRVPSSSPGTIFHPSLATTSDTFSEPVSYYSAPGSNSIVATTTDSVVHVIPTTTMISHMLSSSTFNQPQGQNTGGSPTSGSFDNPAATNDGFLPSSYDLSQHGGISSGAVAAVAVIGAFILAALLLLVVRRYLWVKRQWRLAHIRRTGWSTTFNSGGRADNVSSAVTSYAIRTPLSFADPVMPPPMAEIRDDHGLPTRNPGKPRYSMHPPRPLRIEVSPYSDTRSTHADTIPNNLNSSYLVIPDGLTQLQPEIATPMSVRPFTPSESFSFPKPPSNGAWIPAMDRDSHGTALSSSTEMYPPSSTNPSSEPEFPIIPQHCPVETICRTFEPTLYDELTVAIGDRVKVLEVFDDGWAMVEKIPEGNGKGNEVGLEPGLIPIDCLRMTGDPLPPFLTSKRVTSQTSLDVAI
ncbi:uncharacterized protein BT62DRAFT_960019 [Guyanagaster necrorhizus]|uniref:SH3 domain-containing protein n=1 Tax=Guyanagaster necrorhizus TaxID=856835 RepID=A0A9P7W4K1_9AGAR|nr:uncharacterized protein BT62DRAFT_960019 [Guyanagaster necrorhizus MCA 3950]KAG7452033.1 hypothetical protein BT62DRAFT_960019 [Guyanagaster necrorhizus MCA 3950]